MPESMTVHPLASRFPMLPHAELRDLADDIKANGLIHPLVRKNGVLLDGRNRLAACEMAGVKPRFREFDGDSVASFILAVNIKRRHMDASQRAAAAVVALPFLEEEARLRMMAGVKIDPRASWPEGAEVQTEDDRRSREQAAKETGASGRSVARAKAVEEASPELLEKVLKGEVTVSKAEQQIRAEAKQKEMEEAAGRVAIERRASIESVCDLRVCSCADLFASGIKPDAVITDPPYPEEFLPVFSELAEGCAITGVPLVAVMSGQSYLPEVMARLTVHLKYRWTMAYMTPGSLLRQWPVHAFCGWKPVLVFGEPSEWFTDFVRSDANDKRFHHWGQSVSGMAALVEQLTKPGQLICDPFLGGGTTAVAALALDRRFVGCDIDAGAVESTRMRVLAMADDLSLPEAA